MAENTKLMTVDNICNRVYVIRGQQVMLATVLRGELAEQQSIYIMRAFREMRHT